MQGVRWSVTNVVDILKERQKNEFDGNIAVSGERGNGKSTLIAKILYRFKQFKPYKHQVYSRDDIMKLLQDQQYGICWDDEAINTGYKRNFQEKAQQELIKMLTMYRDNFNIFSSAIPNFFSLDKDLRDLYFIHLHVIERGIAVVHIPLQGRLYSKDRWDSAANAKTETKWATRMQKDSKFKPPYHKLTTFKGYLYFEDLTPKQRELYKKIKKEKRKPLSFVDDKKPPTFIEKVYVRLVAGKLTKEILEQFCLAEGVKYPTALIQLNRKLDENEIKKRVKDFLNPKTKEEQETTADNIRSRMLNYPIQQVA